MTCESYQDLTNLLCTSRQLYTTVKLLHTYIKNYN